MKPSFADILQGLDGERARKVARKLPVWATAGAEIPSALALEQCSSEATARYKACLAARIVSGEATAATAPGNRATLGIVRGRGSSSEGRGRAKRDVSRGSWPLSEVETILDIPGGLGVDSWAFSQVADRVVYFERDAALAEAAARNFARLGAAGIEVRCETVAPQTDLPEADLVYADPARRSAAGRKVFLLEDCTPDILTLLPLLLRKAPAVLLKLSPMADLAMLAGRLGTALHEIHVVALDGEVKELLCVLRREPAETEPETVVVLLHGDDGPAAEPLRFRPQQEREAVPVYAGTVRPGDTLLVPSPALLKAGAFHLPCALWGLQKLAPSTHLYTGAYPPNPPAASSSWFKAYSIREVLPFGNAAFRQLRQRYPQAEVTARNLPLGSEALQKKMGIAPGGDAHIFACRLADGSAVLLAC